MTAYTLGLDCETPGEPNGAAQLPTGVPPEGSNI